MTMTRISGVCPLVTSQSTLTSPRLSTAKMASSPPRIAAAVSRARSRPVPTLFCGVVEDVEK